jgi:hypothetical protein
MGKLSFAELAAQYEKTGYGFEPLPEGAYNVVVAGAKFQPSKAGNDMYKLELQITDGEYKGKKAFTQLVFTENSAGMFFQQMAALGLDAAFWAEIEYDPEATGEDAEEQRGEVCQQLVDAEAVIICGPPEEYQGRMQTRVKTIRPAGTEVGGFGGKRRRALDDDEDGQEAAAPAATTSRRRRRGAGLDDEESTGRTSRSRPDLPPGV